MKGLLHPFVGTFLLVSLASLPGMALADAMGPGLGFAIGANAPGFDKRQNTPAGKLRAQAAAPSGSASSSSPMVSLPAPATDNPQCESGGQPCPGAIQQAVDDQLRAKGLKHD